MKVCHICKAEMYAVIDDKAYCWNCYLKWLVDVKTKGWLE